jgi:amino acid transporter
MITITCILLHRLQGRKLPPARYSLGKWGVVTNVIALVYVTPIFVFSFFPSAPNPTPVSMNWAILMVGGVVFSATVYYVVYGRYQYSPPNETVEDYIQRAQAGETSGGVKEVRAGEEKVMDDSVVVDAVDRDR